ncbi:MAG: L,D-transpeptidase [Methyloceanibacter sp.]|jgi:lipoprotein-anchoring transpeptidase ErfK/SrfK
MTDPKTRSLRRLALLLPLFGLLLGFSGMAQAGVTANISLSTQRMNVFVDGKARYSWPVSTARRGYRTPTGTFKPQSLKVWHRSTIYHGSPMPHSIFFKGGYAIHGSYETKSLGRPASHGCVRLHPSNAAQLFSLVRQYGSSNTVIKISN